MGRTSPEAAWPDPVGRDKSGPYAPPTLGC
jgi:hypothetical protein